jgi:hypothetical protein
MATRQKWFTQLQWRERALVPPFAGAKTRPRHSAAAPAVRLVVSPRVLTACSSNPLIPLVCVGVSSQDHDGGGR